MYPLPKLKTSVTLMFPSFLSPWNLLPGRQSMRLAVDIYNHPTSDAVGTPHSPHHRHQRMLHSSGPVTAGSWEPPDNPHRSQLRLTDLDELPQGSFVRRLVVLEVVRRWVIRSVTLRNPPGNIREILRKETVSQPTCFSARRFTRSTQWASSDPLRLIAQT